MHEKLKPIISKLDRFQYKIDKSSLMSDIFGLCACKISFVCDSAQKEIRQEEYNRIIKNYSEKDLIIIDEIIEDIFNLCMTMADPDGEIYDWLGELYMYSQTSSKQAGQFFTPFHLSRLCAKTALENQNFDKIITLDEPSCGGGGMVLATIELLRNKGINYAENLFVHCADLDSRCVRMCYIQLSLAGVPAVIHKRDTLSMKTFETWYTPAYTFNYLKFRKYGKDC